MTRRGRPSGSLGEISTRALELATARPCTYLDFHIELGLSRRAASVAVFNLVGSGRAVEVDRRQVPGARKPVPVISAAPPVSVEDKLALLAAWPGLRPAS